MKGEKRESKDGVWKGEREGGSRGSGGMKEGCERAKKETTVANPPHKSDPPVHQVGAFRLAIKSSLH